MKKLAVQWKGHIPVVTIADLIAAGDQCGCRDLSSATMPAI